MQIIFLSPFSIPLVFLKMSEENPILGIDKIDAEMNSVIENLEKSISRLKGKLNDEKRLERCTTLIKKFNSLLESLRLDVATMDISNPSKRDWEMKLSEHQQRIDALKIEFNGKRREIQKKVLLKTDPARADKIKNLSGEEDVTQLDRQQALAVGDVLIDKAEKSLARTKKLVVESEQLGINTLQKMDTQNEQMEKIYEDFDEIDGNLARSKRILGHIAQTAVNDRCIQILTLFVFIAVIIVLVQQFKKSDPTKAPARLRRLVVAVKDIANGNTGRALMQIIDEDDN